jgi:hypothetical protein
MRRAGGGRLAGGLVLAIAFMISGCDDSGGASPAGQTSTPPAFGGDPVPTPTAVRTSGSGLQGELLPEPAEPTSPLTIQLFPEPEPGVLPEETSSTETPDPPPESEDDGDGDSGEAVE